MPHTGTALGGARRSGGSVIVGRGGNGVGMALEQLPGRSRCIGCDWRRSRDRLRQWHIPAVEAVEQRQDGAARIARRLFAENRGGPKSVPLLALSLIVPARTVAPGKWGDSPGRLQLKGTGTHPMLDSRQPRLFMPLMELALF
jgi:hypothetical protein